MPKKLTDSQINIYVWRVERVKTRGFVGKLEIITPVKSVRRPVGLRRRVANEEN